MKQDIDFKLDKNILLYDLHCWYTQFSVRSYGYRDETNITNKINHLSMVNIIMHHTKVCTFQTYTISYKYHYINIILCKS